MTLPIYTHIPNLKGLTKIFLKLSCLKGNLCGGVTVLNSKYPRLSSGDTINYNVVFFRKAGAHGSRLTGAGWGGCTVSLVSVQNVHTFIQQMKTGYYENYLRKPINLSEAIFATSPGDGAKIIKNIKVN